LGPLYKDRKDVGEAFKACDWDEEKFLEAWPQALENPTNLLKAIRAKRMAENPEKQRSSKNRRID
jgi:hypothetical protein